MKVRRARVGSFGTMKDRDFEFDDGLNVVYGPNEAGKTTLKTFITTSFFAMKHKRNLYPSKSGTDKGEVDVVMSDGSERTLKRSGRTGEDLQKELHITDDEYTSIYSLEPEDLREVGLVESGNVRDRLLTIPGAADVPKISKEVQKERKSYLGDRKSSKAILTQKEAELEQARERVDALRAREDGDDNYDALVKTKTELREELGRTGEEMRKLRKANEDAKVEQSRRETRDKISALTARKDALAPSERFDMKAVDDLKALEDESRSRNAELEQALSALSVSEKGLDGIDPSLFLERTESIRTLNGSVSDYRAESATVERLHLSDIAGEESQEEYERIRKKSEESSKKVMDLSARKDALYEGIGTDPVDVLALGDDIRSIMAEAPEHGQTKPPTSSGTGKKTSAFPGSVFLAVAVIAVGCVALFLEQYTAGAVIMATGAGIFLFGRLTKRGKTPEPIPNTTGDAEMEKRLASAMSALGIQYTTYDAGVERLSGILERAENWNTVKIDLERAESECSESKTDLRRFLQPYGGSASIFESAVRNRPEYERSKRKIRSLDQRLAVLCESLDFDAGPFPETVDRMNTLLVRSEKWRDAGAKVDSAKTSRDESVERVELFLRGFGGREAFDKGVSDRKELESVSQQLNTLKDSIPEKSEEVADPEETSAKLKEVTERYDGINNRLGKVDQAILDIEGNQKVEDAISACNEAESDVYKAVGKWAELALEERILDEASAIASSKHRPAVLKNADMFLSDMTGGLYRMSAGLEDERISVEAEDGSRKNLDECSSGLRDQILLSLKMAVSLSLSGERPPVILDDVLLTSDSERKAGACEAIKDLSRDIQVIYFTCDRETRDLMEEKGANMVDF